VLAREAVALFVDVRGLGLRCASLLRPGEVSRARLADVVRLGLLADGDDVRAEGVAAAVLGACAGLVAPDVDAGAGWAKAFAALLGSSASGPSRRIAPPATASVSPAAAAAVITLRPTCTDRE
jgi:hypothetical protein